MIRALVAIAAATTFAAPGRAADWVLQTIPAAGPVKVIETLPGGPVVLIGAGWFRLHHDGNRHRLVATAGPSQRPLPLNALPDGIIAEGPREVARAWLADPTNRYDHGVLGDAIEAESLVVERRDGRRDVVTLPPDAVFEDLRPRIAPLGGSDKVVVVKSHVTRGSALAVIGERDGRYQIVAETPPTGAPHRWLNPAGIADFNGDGHPNVAVVRMPHAVGRLELWSFRDNALHKALELGDVSNHVSGSRAQRMSAVADFDGDGRPDLAIASFDRRRLRLIAFVPGVREIGSIALPSHAVTDFALVGDAAGRPAVLLGLENGALVLARRP
ncbi:MAG: VCBS repeat-containing protein [Xanthobacteraceae bacterium]|nr:VCBS repeat-containing protein [Xanthobacteraceae bacterium]